MKQEVPSDAPKLTYLVAGAVILLLSLSLYDAHHKPVPTVESNKLTYLDKANVTVKIVRSDERSGGTGVILHSGRMSTILTNSHVCGVVKNGGLVITDDDVKYSVYSYKKSARHDLCLISVASNLQRNSEISPTPPMPYGSLEVSGHPSLLPTIITTGHYSGRVRGDIMIGKRRCTQSDLDGPDAILCFFMGGIPIVRTYEMQVVSATIKPGSSGSAVYNDRGQITNLIFAGSGEIGYGLAVPYEYVVNFLSSEVPNLKEQFPNLSRSISGDGEEESTQTQCGYVTNPLLRSACKLIDNNLIYEVK